MASPGEQTDGFASNWAYLKGELQWLERMLMLAVARQRKDTREVDRLSQTKADRITSHWWKGVIALDGNISYDEHRQPQAVAKSTYQQQLEAQIGASQRRGIFLALPVLRDRLHLKEFEKNLILMALAPEVNRRYAQLYRFLQSDSASKSDLPTLDLILRLLCRTDNEWHSVRHYLMTVSPLLKTGLVQLLPAIEQTRLGSPIKLSDRLVNYLLADQPTPADLESLLQGAKQPPIVPAANAIAVLRCVYLQHHAKSCAWSNLILPPELLSSLQYWVQQVAGAQQAAAVWHLSERNQLGQPGRFLLLAGTPGTGKTTAAAAIATALNKPLFTVDLAQTDPADHAAILQEISLHRPTVVLIKSAQFWLSRSSSLPLASLQQWFEERSNAAAITCFSVTHAASVQLQFQRQMDAILTLPVPAAIERLKLWQTAFPPQVVVSEQMPWNAIANQLPISGGIIQQIVRDILFHVAATGASTVEINHLQTVCQQRGYSLELPAKAKRATRSNRQK